MDDERVVGAELTRLAATDPLDPIDPAAMLTRGRRSRRNRRLLGVGGGVIGVAAVVIGASMLPGSVVADPDPGVASTKPSVVTKEPGFSAVPGVPRGEAGVGGQVSAAEATRRCSVRNPDIDRPLRPAPNRQAGANAGYEPRKGDRVTECTVPGGDRPSAELVEAAQKDPLPSTPEGRLRNCSVHFWTDLTKWRIVASDVQPGHGAALVAISPSGKSVALCTLLAATPHDIARVDPNSRIIRTAAAVQDSFEANFQVIPGESLCTAGKCKGWFYHDQGRVTADIARIVIEPRGGGRHELKLTDGWFAVAWRSNDPKGEMYAKVTAYDKAGKVLQVVGG